MASTARKVPVQLRIPFSSVLVCEEHRGDLKDTSLPANIFIEILWTNYLYNRTRQGPSAKEYLEERSGEKAENMNDG